jgi:hypothetical protein
VDGGSWIADFRKSDSSSSHSKIQNPQSSFGNLFTSTFKVGRSMFDVHPLFQILSVSAFQLLPNVSARRMSAENTTLNVNARGLTHTIHNNSTHEKSKKQGFKSE